MKWLKRIAWCLLALLVALGLVVWWLLGSQSGARFVLERAEAALDGQLAVGTASGDLAGLLELHDVRWHGAQADVTVATLRIDPGLLGLLGVNARIDVLEASGIDVLLHPVEQPEPEPEKLSPFDLAPPIDIALDRALLTDISVQNADSVLFEADSIALAGSWTESGVHVATLDVRSPHGYFTLSGDLAQAEGFTGNAKLAFDWTRDGQRYAGNLTSEANGEQVEAHLALTAPFNANLAATLGQTDELPWQATLDVPPFDPQELLGEGKVQRLGLHLEARGDIDNATAEGTVTLNRHQLAIDTLALDWGGTKIEVTALALRQKDGPGVLSAHGTLDSDVEPLAMEIAAQWQDVVLPADLVGQDLETTGQLTLDGTLENWHAKGALAIGPEGETTRFTLDLGGSNGTITLDKVELVQDQGFLAVEGTLQTGTPLRWQLEAEAEDFNPGALLAGWNGSVDLALATAGELDEQGPSGTLKLSRLDGTLRQRPISGSAELAFQPGWIVSGDLRLHSGDSHVRFHGQPGNQIDARIELDVASLADWLPEARGHLAGNLHITGTWPEFALDGTLDAGALAFGETTIDSAHLAVDLQSVWPLAGSAQLTAQDLGLAGFRFDRLQLDADGNGSEHHLSVAAEGTDLDFRLALSGSRAQDRWQGRITELTLAPVALPPWRLTEPAAWSLAAGAFTLDQLCLDAGLPHLCLSAAREASGSVRVDYNLEQLPLSLLRVLVLPETALDVEGTLAGQGHLVRAADGSLDGQAELTSESGSVALDATATEPLLGWSDLEIRATLDGSTQHVTARAQLQNGGHVDGALTISGADQKLDGELEIAIADLGVLELLTPEVAAVEGSARGEYAVGGTVAAPEISGAMAVTGFAAEVPRLGIQLTDGTLAVRAVGADRFALEGHLESGKGAINISGEGGFAADAPLSVSLTGEEFLAADIPAAHVVVTPDLQLTREEQGYLLTGSVTIPRARIDLEQLPGGGGPEESSDVVIVDAETAAESAGVPLRATITVTLGEDVELSGFGLDGALAGTITIHEQPGEPTTATGEIRVSGTYQAYGQDLVIQRGSLLFAGTPIDNPGLNIRAVREIEDADVTVGIDVRGTASRPVLTVFSDPAMEQSEALSYLVTGRPLSALKSGEGDMLQSAARALGTALGDRLAKNLGSKLGVDDIGISSNEAVGGAAFSVGKYLSPSLYLSYGVGLFTPGEVVTLRYIISQRWNLEVQSATEFNRAGLNYRYEK